MIAVLAEAWLMLFLLAAGLAAGALAASATGHLLGENWLAPLRRSLRTVVRAAPLLLAFALPLPLLAGWLYPWASGVPWWRAGGVFALWTLAALLLWAALGWWLARPGERGWRAGVTLLLLVPTAALAMEGWALSRDPAWTGSLQGLALFVEQVGAATALVALVSVLRDGMPDDEARTGLERTLLTLALLTLWLWFIQFIVVWAADLPPEAAWYLRRAEGVWFWVYAAVGLPALLGALALSLLPQWSRWRLLAVCGLMLAAHLAHLGWIVRPDAPGGGSAGWADLLAFGLVAAAVFVIWRTTKPGSIPDEGDRRRLAGLRARFRG